MDPKNTRKVYAPYSTSGEQVGQTPLTGYVDVAQAIYPAVNTGQVSTEGEWSGVVVSDKSFLIDTKHEGVPNGASVLVPQKQPDRIDMTGYRDLYIAIKPSRSGNCAVVAVMGADTNTFANLTPVNAAATLRYIAIDDTAQNQDFRDCLNDAAEAMTADVWNIFNLQGVVANQKNLQFDITNSSGGNSDIEFAYMRVV